MRKLIVPFLLVMFASFLASCSSEGGPDKDIMEFTEDNFSAETASGVVLVDFWATWCMPCRAMAPVIDEIAAQTRGKVKVGKVDIDKNGQLANAYGIQAIPTLIILKDGAAVEKLMGVQSKESVIEALSRHVDLGQ